MAAGRESIHETITKYVDSLTRGTDEIMSLFAEGATVEDPVGSGVRTTRESIREFFAGIEGLNRGATLGIVRIADGQAAFSFEVELEIKGRRYTLTSIDVMTFDDDGRITSMRAFWSDHDMIRS